MKPNVLQNLDKNDLLSAEAKSAFKELYNKSSLITFGKIDKRNDGYILNDLKLPRCTSVLSMDGTKAGALMEWAKRQVSERIYKELEKPIIEGKILSTNDVYEACNIGLMDPDRQKDEAADTGTARHDNIENFLTGYQYEDDEPLSRFKEAWNNFGGTVVATEIPVVWHDGNGHGFGGRVDALLYKDGKWIVGDNKTSRSVHESYACQISGYSKAIEQMTNGLIKIERGAIFHIPDFDKMSNRQKKEYDKRGSLIYIDKLEEAFGHYRLLLELYYRRNNKYF